MITVYVKHYLTEEGIDYFKNTWFPSVLAHLSEQKGFLLLSYRGNQDCMDITLQFQDHETLNNWIAVPIHDELIRDLDIYRSRPYWEAAQTCEEQTDPAALEWEIISLA